MFFDNLCDMHTSVNEEKYKLTKLFNAIKMYININVHDIVKELNFISNPENSRFSFVQELFLHSCPSEYEYLTRNNYFIKTILFDDDNKLKESIPLNSINISDMDIKINWEESLFYKSLIKNKIIFVSFKRSNDDSLFISDIFLFKFNNHELLNAQKVYLDTKKKFNFGKIKIWDENKKIYSYNLIKMSDDMDFHIRPRAKNSNDVYKTQYGEEITRQAFWLNKYVVEKRYYKQLLNKEMNDNYKQVERFNDVCYKKLTNKTIENNNVKYVNNYNYENENLFVEYCGFKICENEKFTYAFKDVNGFIWNDIPIEYFNISNRLYNCLSKVNILNLREILHKTYNDIISIPSFGNKCLYELMEIIKKHIVIIDIDSVHNYSNMEIEQKTKKTKKTFNFNNDNCLIYSILDENIDKKNIFVKGIKEVILDNLKISEMNLSVRSFNCLKQIGVNTFRDLIFMKSNCFSSIENLGDKSKREIVDKICEITFVYKFKNKVTKINEKIVDNFINKNNHLNIFYNLQLFKNILLNNLNEEQFSNLLNSNVNNLLKGNHEWTSYIEGFIINLINKSYNKFLTFSEIEHQFFDDNFLFDNIISFLNDMEYKKKLKKIEDNYYLNYLTVEEILLNNQNIREKNVVTLRLFGYTLEEIGKKLNITRERVRQIFSKFINEIEFCWEDSFKFIFIKYDFNQESFSRILNMPVTSYNYLLSKYEKGKNSIFDLHKDISMPKCIRQNSHEYCKTIGIFDENNFIMNNRSQIVDYLLEKECKSDIHINIFYKIYNDFLDKYKIKTDKNEYLLRVLENKISSKRNVLWKWKKYFRYFDFDSVNIEQFLKDLNLIRFNNKEIATQLLLNTNPEIIEKYGIKDEYELHNFLKKIVELDDIDLGVRITFLRMPNIGIGNFSREKQIEDLLFNEAPIKDFELAEIYSSIYGVKPQNVIANYFAPINKYLSKGIFRVDYINFTDEEYFSMKKELHKRIYYVETIINIYCKNFPNGDVKKINTFNMDRLNYKIVGAWVYSKNYTSIEGAIRSYFSNEADIVILDEELLKLYSNNTFSMFKDNITKKYNWIQFEKDKFININALRKQGIFLEDIYDFCDVSKKIVGNSFFTFKYLLNNGLEHKILDLGFENYFYESVFKKNNNIGFRILSNITLFKFNSHSDSVTFGELITEILSKILSIDIYDLIQLLSDNYGIKVEKGNLISLIKSTSLYYSSIWEKVYIDYDKYFEEI